MVAASLKAGRRTEFWAFQEPRWSWRDVNKSLLFHRRLSRFAGTTWAAAARPNDAIKYFETIAYNWILL